MARIVEHDGLHDLTQLAVIPVCYNPVKYKTRYNLYRNFEKHMLQSGVVLFTVECLFESALHFGLPKQVVEVTQADNSRHLQLIAPSILWMKENLINVAVDHLPEHIQYVAWIDTDIEFDRYPIVQLFRLALFLGPNGMNEILHWDYSFAYSIKHNKPIDPQRYKEWYPHPGYAWAMRCDAFEYMGGLCEFSILGSGDLHFAFALLNRIEETFLTSLNEDYRRLALNWGERVAEIAQGGHNVGYLPVNIGHFWHGSRGNRGYVERW
ncbi:unnamed protein product [Rotaria sp. Silwood2]|nr:unnamed protein product [Rotaria sp. Silwood2]